MNANRMMRVNEQIRMARIERANRIAAVVFMSVVFIAFVAVVLFIGLPVVGIAVRGLIGN